MISSLRNFAKTKLAGIFIFIIIIPFVFWGMGSVFNSGNTNNIAKVNNINISTKDFMDYLNKSNLSTQVIKENLDQNIIEELLSSLVSVKILDIEIKDLNILISQDVLIKKIKKNKNFIDENGIFQRTLYEKFLLANNITAPLYELRLKNNELQKQLFNYVHGGIQAPKFLVKKTFEEENKKIFIDYISLNNFYKKLSDVTEKDIKEFIKDNSKELKQDHINFSYIKITPKQLIGIDEFNQTFFDKIDEIENKISKNIDFNSIIKELDIKPIIINDYANINKDKSIESKIYNNRNDKIEIIEYDGSYILYQINEINSKIPSLIDSTEKNRITDLFLQKNKYEFNKKIFDEINNNEFNQISFEKLGKNLIEKTNILSIKDNKKFDANSVEVLYSLPLNSFTLISDENENVYVAKIVEYEEKKIKQNSKEFDKYSIDVSAKNRNVILKSYDYFLNDKYEVTINQKTLDRVKNYFK